MMMPVQQLFSDLEQAKRVGDDRTVAETAYALAVRLRDEGDLAQAQICARESLHAAERLPSSTLEDVVSTKREVGGVPLPDLLHAGVVRVRLEGLLSEWAP